MFEYDYYLHWTLVDRKYTVECILSIYLRSITEGGGVDITKILIT